MYVSFRICSHKDLRLMIYLSFFIVNNMVPINSDRVFSEFLDMTDEQQRQAIADVSNFDSSSINYCLLERKS